MFKFLNELYKGGADFKWVIELFSDGHYDGTSNTHVTLNKYLNALRLFGIKVKKINGKYHMLSPLYKMKFNLNDIKSINTLKKACEILPDGKNKLNCNEFVKALEIRFDESAQSFMQMKDNTKSLNLDFYYSEMVEQIKLCEKYCQDKQKLELIYTDDKNNEINLLCSPLETIYKKRKICLKVLGNNGSRVYEVPVENILSLKQLPSAVNTNAMPTTVCYKIKNRLAKNYRIRDWEKVQDILPDGSKIIINKDEDFDLLLSRLMRYGTECEIISPRYIKEEMLNLINKTLLNYQ